MSHPDPPRDERPLAPPPPPPAHFVPDEYYVQQLRKRSFFNWKAMTGLGLAVVCVCLVVLRFAVSVAVEHETHFDPSTLPPYPYDPGGDLGLPLGDLPSPGSLGAGSGVTGDSEPSLQSATLTLSIDGVDHLVSARKQELPGLGTVLLEQPARLHGVFRNLPFQVEPDAGVSVDEELFIRTADGFDVLIFEGSLDAIDPGAVTGRQIPITVGAEAVVAEERADPNGYEAWTWSFEHEGASFAGLASATATSPTEVFLSASVHAVLQKLGAPREEPPLVVWVDGERIALELGEPADISGPDGSVRVTLQERPHVRHTVDGVAFERPRSMAVSAKAGALEAPLVQVSGLQGVITMQTVTGLPASERDELVRIGAEALGGEGLPSRRSIAGKERSGLRAEGEAHGVGVITEVYAVELGARALLVLFQRRAEPDEEAEAAFRVVAESLGPA